MRLCSAILAAVAVAVCTACINPVHGAARIPMGEEGRYVHARRPPPKTYTKPPCGPTNQITQWGKLVNASVPILPEYPRPQMTRPASSWVNFNGLWEYEPAAAGPPTPPFGRQLNGSVLVPFPVESCLSGVGITSKYLWYRLVVQDLAFEQHVAAGGRVLLHFDAVDWQTTVYVNQHNVGSHTGGYEQFTCDITDAIQSGGSDNEVVVHVYDPSDEGFQPNGKQRISAITNPGGDTYTPSSGIWQTVWAEFVPKNYVQYLRIDQSMSSAVVTVTSTTAGTGVSIDVMDEGTVVGTFTGTSGSPIILKPPSPVKLWQPYTQGEPFLYTMTIKLETGDEVGSYFGLRSVSLGTAVAAPTDDTGPQLGADRPGSDMAGYPKPLPSADPSLCWKACNETAGCEAWAYGLPNCGGGSSQPLCWLKSARPGVTANKCRVSGAQGTPGGGSVTRPLINGKFTFLAGWLDQSFWPDGLYRAPTDDALKFDVQAVKQYGLNYVRLHQKTNPPRWYTYIETEGIALQQDMIQKYGGATAATVEPFIAELNALVTGPRYNSPAIFMWTVFNEHDCVAQFNATAVVNMVQQFDPSRLVDTDSGGPANNLHIADANDVHTYPIPGNPMPSESQFAMVGEFGGIGAFVQGKEWVAGKCTTYLHVDTPGDEAATYAGFAQIIASQQGSMSASVYTQITDVELECDGFLNYDRTPKFTSAQRGTVVGVNQQLSAYGQQA